MFIPLAGQKGKKYKFALNKIKFAGFYHHRNRLQSELDQLFLFYCSNRLEVFREKAWLSY
ncbi:hypothetical protein AKJ31_06645 [Vibrio hepatarius]|uniref:Uncharacterized protein n=1 Tax=Vibrio hepatarius TaxID=171383 RepID=A0A0M0I2X1_9VIBR|nr:hypothetical protein AKJ31_06645 [Vibrio hepatarius]